MTILLPPSNKWEHLVPRIGIATFLLFFFWSQVLLVPYWQDDYYYLLDALRAEQLGESLLAAFFPESKTNFWRPLGMESYWRVVQGLLEGNVVLAHGLNIFLLLGAAAAVGWFAATFAKLLIPSTSQLSVGLLVFLLYGVHSSHFLAVAWTAAANSSIAVIFGALSLRFWLVTTAISQKEWGWSGLLTILCLALALLSRDSAIVLPAFGILLTVWLRIRNKPLKSAWLTGGLCIAVAIVWLVLRNHFTLPVHPAYEPRLGMNVLRNVGAFFLFLFNTPFEALRFFFFVDSSPTYVLWGIACFALQAIAFVTLVRSLRGRVNRNEGLILATLFVVGCAPYFLLSVNCYPYYLSLGLFAYAIAISLANFDRRRLELYLLLSVLSSALATAGNYYLESPSHIGRAFWAERQLVIMKTMHDSYPELFSPLIVSVIDEHRFLGFRAEGIVYRLGVPIEDIVFEEDISEVTGQQAVLVVPKEGDVYFTARDH